MESEDSALKSLVSDLTANKQAQKRAMSITVIAVFLSVLWVAYSLYEVTRLNSEAKRLQSENTQADLELKNKQDSIDKLDQKLEEIKRTIEHVQPIIDQSLTATRQSRNVESATTPGDRQTVRIQYFPKDPSEQKVQGALRQLGFSISVSKRPEGLEGTFTNCVWFGSAVDIQLVKLVAYTLIQNGLQIREIMPFLNSNGRESLIQIGGRKLAVDKPVWTVEKIQTAAKFSR
jgi:hypothetical protein